MEIPSKDFESYLSFFQTIPDIVYAIDVDGRFTFLNDAVQQLKCTPEDLIGQHFRVIVHPDDLGLVSRQITLPKYEGKITGDEGAPKLFDERRTNGRMTKNLEIRLIPKGCRDYSKDCIYGELHSSGKWSSDVKELEKKFLGSIGIIRDITGRKRAEQELARLASFPRLNPNPVIEVATDGVITYVNPAAQEQFPELYHLRDKHPFLQNLSSSVDTLKKSKRMYILKDVEYNKRIYELDISYLPESSHIRMYISDITERKQMDKLKDEFVSTVSHELRTPLSITKEGISSVLDKIHGQINSRQADILRISKNNIDRLTRIVDNLLDVSKIEFGKVEFERKAVDMIDVVKQLAIYFEPKIKAKGLALHVHIPKEKIDVYADRDSVIQVFTNLIGNAIKFTEKGAIDISVMVKKAEIQCAVRDTGIGIRREDFPVIFNKFTQFGQPSSGSEKGTGLGLAIAKGIIEMHGGHIQVDSELGKGAVFTFTLPQFSDYVRCRECVRDSIRQAKDSGRSISLITISTVDLHELLKTLGTQRMHVVLKEVDAAMSERLRSAKKFILEETGEIIIILMNCDATGGQVVKKRLEDVLRSYIYRQRLSAQMSFCVAIATYPDDAETCDGLIRKARKRG